MRSENEFLRAVEQQVREHPQAPAHKAPNGLTTTYAELWLSLIHISEPTRQAEISYAVFCLKKKKTHTTTARKKKQITLETE